MGRDLVPISVWWDINSCPVPSGYDPHLVGPRITSALKDAGYSPINITVIGNLEHTPDEVLRQINSTGIALRHVLCEYQTDMVECWVKEQPRCLMLISGHEQLEIFAPTFFNRPLRSSLLVAHPGRQKGSQWLWKSFLLNVKREWIWESFLEGSADSNQLCGTGELSCKTCNSSLLSFEDFTKHVKSGKHTQQVTTRTFASIPPSEHVATTTVLWDINSCPLPRRSDPRLAGLRIKSALKNSGYIGPVTITAIGNLELTPRTSGLLEPLFSSGINLANIFGCRLSQLFDWRRRAQPPATLMLICGPTTLEVLSKSLFRIWDEGYTILVAHPGRKKGSQWLWKSFLSVVSRDWIWKSFLGSADNEEEALEYKCSEPGYVSCEMCEFFGFSLKDLTTHFSSDEHLQEVSDRKPLDKHSSSTETEHVVEQEHHQLCTKRRA